MADMQVQTLQKPSTSKLQRAYERPADALLSGSISSGVENGFVRNATHPEPQGSLANGRAYIPGNVDNRTETPAALRPCLSSIPDPSFRLMSRMTQAALSKSVWLLKVRADENRMGSYACCWSKRFTHFNIPGSSSTTR